MPRCVNHSPDPIPEHHGHRRSRRRCRPAAPTALTLATAPPADAAPTETAGDAASDVQRRAAESATAEQTDTGDDDRGEGARQHVHRGTGDVAVGTEVVWKNGGSNDHDIVPVADGERGASASTRFHPGDDYSYVFTEPGEYPYYCTIHGTADVGMTGTIIVTLTHVNATSSHHTDHIVTPHHLRDLNMKASHRARLASGLLALVLVAAACGGSDGDSADEQRRLGPTGHRNGVHRAPTTEPATSESPTTDAADDTTPPDSEPGATECCGFPDDFATITEAVDAAVPGDLVLIGPGTYHEAVNVVTDDVTIRGLDRNEVILDGEFELDNGIRILGATGVVVENLTAQNYTSNGVFALEADGYRVSYVNAHPQR